MSQNNQEIDTGGSLNSTKDLFTNIAFTLSSFSPIIVPLCMLFGSLFSASMNKFGVYLGCFAVSSAIRYIIMTKAFTHNIPMHGEDPICKQNLFTFPHAMFSTFTIAFTFAYIMLPNIIVASNEGIGTFNFSLIGIFLVYLAFDMIIKQKFKCVKVVSTLTLTELLLGIGAGATSIAIYYINKSYVYISSSSGSSDSESNAETCSMPSQTKFKCSVYKNGELVSSQTK